MSGDSDESGDFKQTAAGYAGLIDPDYHGLRCPTYFN
jgi:hypothetical protein